MLFEEERKALDKAFEDFLARLREYERQFEEDDAESRQLASFKKFVQERALLLESITIFDADAYEKWIQITTAESEKPWAKERHRFAQINSAIQQRFKTLNKQPLLDALARADSQVRTAYLGLPSINSSMQGKRSSNDNLPDELKKLLLKLSAAIEAAQAKVIKDFETQKQLHEDQQIQEIKSQADETMKKLRLDQEQLKLRQSESSLALTTDDIEEKYNEQINKQPSVTPVNPPVIHHSPPVATPLEIEREIYSQIFAQKNLSILEGEVRYYGGKALENGKKLPHSVHDIFTNRAQTLKLTIESAKRHARRRFLCFFKPVGRTQATQEYLNIIAAIKRSKIDVATLIMLKEAFSVWRAKHGKPPIAVVSEENYADSLNEQILNSEPLSNGRSP